MRVSSNCKSRIHFGNPPVGTGPESVFLKKFSLSGGEPSPPVSCKGPASRRGPIMAASRQRFHAILDGFTGRYCPARQSRPRPAGRLLGVRPQSMLPVPSPCWAVPDRRWSRQLPPPTAVRQHSGVAGGDRQKDRRPAQLMPATVTWGAASALTVATAACMAGKDLEKIARPARHRHEKRGRRSERRTATCWPTPSAMPATAWSKWKR